MSGFHMPLAVVLPLLEKLANNAIHLWDVPAGARARLINMSENATYLVEAPGNYKSIMRVHRENYHTHRAIECELAWLDALGTEGVVATPGYYIGKNGHSIQECLVDGLPDPRLVDLFHFVEGIAPDENDDMTSGYEELGAIAAHCHSHVMTWPKPEPFTRLTWDVDSVFGVTPIWGDWRDAPEVTPAIRAVLQQVEVTIRTRLAAYGKAPDRFNLIHADMRLANLLVGEAGTRLIDFDDCGHGWFMYDFAASISFIEDDPRIPDLRAAWLKGYRSVQPLSAEDEAEIDTFILMRRMALLAWIGSHIEAPEPQELAPGFAATTAQLGQEFLDAQSKVECWKTNFRSFYYADAEPPDDITLDPNKTALLVIDIQNTYLEVPTNKAEADRWAPFFDRMNHTVIPNTASLIAWSRKTGIEVMFARIACLKEDGRDRSLSHKNPGFNYLRLPKDRDDSQIVDALSPKGDEIVITKTTDSALTGTNLRLVLHNMGITDVIVAGIFTDQCVSSTVRSLCDESFKVLVTHDACAAATDKLQKHELEIINMIYCHVISCEEVMSFVKK